MKGNHPAMIPLPRHLPRVLPVVLALLVAPSVLAATEDVRVGHARALLQRAGAAGASLKVDPTVGHPEGFIIRHDPQGATVLGGGPAGVLYGAQELASGRASRDGKQAPDFEIRGAALLLMKEGTYDYRVTPEEFPWFYDRPLLTKYLDTLFENRFNTIFLWSADLFSSLVELPEYPDATNLSRAELARNQDQFRWLTSEAAKRNISVLVHFYNIHLPEPLAKARKIPMHYKAPDPFAAKYLRYTLERFGVDPIS
jgi:hypothetical protein